MLLFISLIFGLLQAQPPLVVAAQTTTSFRPQFTVPASATVGLPVIANVNDPEAVDAQTVCPGYLASNVKQNDNGFLASLSLAGEACNVYGTDIDQLDLVVQFQSSSRLEINISPSIIDSSNYSHYILSEEYVQKPLIDASAGSTIDGNAFNITWSNSPSFAFSVSRKSTGDVIFNTFGSKLVYENQFIEFVTSMPENYNVYGLGERIHGLRLGNNLTATTYAADAGTPLDYNIYGTHPVYLDTRYFEQSSNGDWSLLTSNETNAESTYKSYSHAVYNRNAHGQEVILGASNITWRLLGGSVDLYFFDGPAPAEAIKNYQSVATGFPAMQQYFAFGYHQCRWGYTNWTELQAVVDNFKRFNIPLENIWTDIDYMKEYRDFEMDPNTFPIPEGQKFLEQLHANGQHYIPIVDSAIYIPDPGNASDAYPPYDRGNASDIFLRNPDGSQYIGSVWPGYTVFPDWHSEQSVSWWVNEMLQWHKDIPFDAIWIDMSEVSSFCVGSCGTENLTLNPVSPPFLLPGAKGNVDYNYPEGFNLTNATEASSASSASERQAAATSTSSTSSSSTSYYRSRPTLGVRDVNWPPYTIKNIQGDLAVHAVSPNATHADGVEEYDVHNLFGHQILNATYQALLAIFPGKRPLIIGRSTFAGSGKWAGHWGGDNVSKWTDMFFSIPQALTFSIFGIPLFGPDTCGFASNSDEELCNRWMQLSAFFPFYRNHNTLGAASQEPYLWASVGDASRKAMHIRYSLLPYLYTLFWAAHTQGDTVMRALAWEFPNEPALAAADRQFMLGPALLVTPVLNQGATSVDGVFPGGNQTVWYDWYTQSAVSVSKPGANITIQAPLGHIPVYVRGGYVLPLQEPGYTTSACRKNPWGLIVALDASGCAKGELYIDDGESLKPSATLEVKFAASAGTLNVTVTGDYKDSNALANVTVLGVGGNVGKVLLNGKGISESGVAFNGTSGVLSLTGLNSLTSAGAWNGDWVLSWA